MPGSEGDWSVRGICTFSGPRAGDTSETNTGTGKIALGGGAPCEGQVAGKRRWGSTDELRAVVLRTVCRCAVRVRLRRRGACRGLDAGC